VVGREHAERDRLAGFESDAADAGGHFLADVFEMRRLAANDSAETHHGRIAVETGRLERNERQLEGTRYGKDIVVIALDAELSSRFARAFEQVVGDRAVKAANDHGDANGRGRSHSVPSLSPAEVGAKSSRCPIFLRLVWR